MQFPLRMKYIIVPMTTQNVPRKWHIKGSKKQNQKLEKVHRLICSVNQIRKFIDKIVLPMLPLMSETWHIL